MFYALPIRIPPWQHKVSESVETKTQFKAPRKFFCAENQSENRLKNYTLGSLVPKTGDLASTPEAEIFGTPLPDDQEDGLSGVNEAQVNNFSIFLTWFAS